MSFTEFLLRVLEILSGTLNFSLLRTDEIDFNGSLLEDILIINDKKLLMND